MQTNVNPIYTQGHRRTIIGAMPTQPLSRPFTVAEFLQELDRRLEEYTLAEVARPFGTSRQVVYSWSVRRRKPNRLTLLLARYVWTYGKLPD